MSSLLDFLSENLPPFRKGRLPSLYSDFRQQQYSNPDGYNANVAAWEAALALAAESQVIPASTSTLTVFANSDLVDALESREWGLPSSLGTVFSEAISHGRFVSQAAFLQAKPGAVGSHSGTVSWSLASWALKLLGVSSWITEKLPNEPLVILANVKKAYEKLHDFITQQRGRVDQVWTIAVFRAEVSRLLGLKGDVTEDDLRILLTYLSRDRNLLAYNDSTIKFRVSSSESLQITESDQSIASLKSLISDLSSQVNEISSRIDSLDQQARSAIAVKNRNAALRHLKAKKMQESVLTQRSNTLVQLEDVLAQIEQAINQVEVMAVLKSSTSVLKGLNAELGDLDSLQDVLDSINEETMKTHEISNAIGDTTQAGLVIDEGEIDDELASLEAEIQAKQTKDDVDKIQEKLQRLPGLEDRLTAADDISPARQAIEETH